MIQGIQCDIGGFSGAPVTLFSALDAESGILTLAALAPLRKTRYQDCVVIGNVQGLERDQRFGDEHLRDAIHAWNALQHDRVEGGAAKLIYSEAARRANPSSVIEPDGLNERGRQYRLAENAGNETVAALAACWWAHKAFTRADVLDTADELADRLISGEVVTIGGKIPPHQLYPVFKHGYQVDQAAASAYWDERDR